VVEHYPTVSASGADVHLVAFTSAAVPILFMRTFSDREKVPVAKIDPIDALSVEARYDLWRQ
jgi:hypothetical protein